jgi:hypothetical protein
MAKKEKKKDDVRELDLIKTIGANLKAAIDQQSDWRKETEQCDNFVAGHQWDKADVSRMREAQKPAITYNRIQPTVRLCWSGLMGWRCTTTPTHVSRTLKTPTGFPVSAL